MKKSCKQKNKEYESKIFSDILAEFLSRNKYSVKQLKQIMELDGKLKISINSIERWIKGKQFPNLNNILYLSDILKISLSEILTAIYLGKEEKNEHK